MAQAFEEYRERYARLLAFASSALGPPDFSGSWRSPGLPEDQMAVELAYWDTPQGRAQIEFDQPDADFPFYVRMACDLRENQV